MPGNRVALILGAGARVGASVAQKFASQGYQVAIVSRSGRALEGSEGASFLSLAADFSKPDSIPAVFEAVERKFNAPPSVVIYNAAAMTPPPVENELFSLPAEKMAADLNVNVVAAYVAAQQAVDGWKKLPEGAKKTFIYTGNAMNTMVLPVPAMVNLGIGKSASAYWIGLADMLHQGKGCRFFYADERAADGKLKGGALDGDAHAEFFHLLAEHDGSIPWHATFVKDRGYVQFK